jgi:hypothetical protein
LWSSAFVTAGFLLGGGAKKIDPLTLTALRFMLGGLIILGVGKFTGRPLWFNSKRQFYLVLGTALTNNFDLNEAVQSIERIGRTKEQIVFYAHSIIPEGKHSHHISLGDLEILLGCAKKNNVQVTGLTE